MTEITRPQADALAALVHERWAPIPGYERTYRVSTLGRVYSVPRPRTPGGLLAWSPDRRGYPRVTLVQDGRQKKIRVHLLVMRAFVGEAPAGMEVCHNDGDSGNPALANLRYDTHQANAVDAVRHGANAQAGRTHCPKGHPYDEANTVSYPSSEGRRYCLTCRRARGREAWHRRNRG